MTQNFILNKLPELETNQRIAADYADMDVSSMQTLLPFLLTSKMISSAYSQFFATYDLSDGKFAVLAVLDERPHKNYAPSELADKIGVTRAAVTNIVDGLVQAGLIERQNGITDRRMQVIALTEAGHQLLERLMPDHYRRTAQLFTNITQIERQLLRALLEKLTGGLDALKVK